MKKINIQGLIPVHQAQLYHLLHTPKDPAQKSKSSSIF